MLSIGEFSNICKVSTKTLRYYAEIGLILPSVINPENGYRYYSIEQLETMLFINRLKSYNFSLEEIKLMVNSEKMPDDTLFYALNKKKKELEKQIQHYKSTVNQLNEDLSSLKEGKSIMSYMENIDIQLVEVPMASILSLRRMVHQNDFPEEYGYCFNKLFKRIQDDHLTVVAPPVVLFHGDEFSPFGLDTEFAVPIKEYVCGTRDFYPKLCLKTVLKGSYTNLSSVYTKQIEYAQKEGYQNNGPLYEVYVNSLLDVQDENELITEVYYPVKKKN